MEELFVGSTHSASSSLFAPNTTSQPSYYSHPQQKTYNLSRIETRIPEQKIYQYKSPEYSFFPLFTATPRVQPSQAPKTLYYSNLPRPNINHYPREEMPQQSLLDQMSSGAIFALNPSYQNPTVTRYNRLYTEMPNSYTALAPNVVQYSSRQEYCHRPLMQTQPKSDIKPESASEIRLKTIICKSEYLSRLVYEGYKEYTTG